MEPKKTLVVIPGLHQTELRMKGLSLKNGPRLLCKDETGFYIEHNLGNTNPRTATIKVECLVEFLKELYQKNPFGRIKLKDNYEITGDQLFQLVLKNEN